jgi:hypothetical protein
LRSIATILSLASIPAFAADAYRQQPCKTPQIAPICLRFHGRLSAGNGTPSIRLWQIGTHHIYGIYSNRYGYTNDSQKLDNESPELHFTFPSDLPESLGWTLYGEFEVCPLEPRIQGHMQAACIAKATHIVASKQ